MRWVRPDFTAPVHSFAFFSSETARCSRAGMSSPMSAPVTATCTEVGNTSLLDCEALTWSFGWTGEPSLCVARVASTSLMFMFELVPEPVW